MRRSHRSLDRKARSGRAPGVLVGLAVLSGSLAAAPRAPAQESLSLEAIVPRAPAPVPELGVPIPVDDPSGRALNRLHAALGRAARGEGKARLLFYGASHTAPDLYTGDLRADYQARWGDGGHGLVLPVRPFRYYDQRDVDMESGGRWRTLRVHGRQRDEDAYGLAGFAVETREDAWAAVQPAQTEGRGSRVSHFEVFYLEQPRGGRMELLVDGEAVRTVDTRARRRGPGYVRIDVEDGHHRLEIRAEGNGRVRLFGVVMERDAPGVIVEAFGVPGARARDQLPWDEDIQTAHLRRRAPDLVALAYGTNESGYENVSLGYYERNLRAVLGRIQRAVPDASCLLIGPSEAPRHVDGVWIPRARTAEIVAVQRLVAEDLGCGFFDLIDFIGGHGSMDRWVEHDPPYAIPDHIHYTVEGHERLAEVLGEALVGALDVEVRWAK